MTDQGRFIFAEPQYCCVYLMPVCIILQREGESARNRLHLRGSVLLLCNTEERKHYAYLWIFC